MPARFLFEKSADSLMGTPLQVTVSFTLAAFKILSLSLILGDIIRMYLGVCFLGSTASLGFSELLEFLGSLFLLPDWGSSLLFFQIRSLFLALPLLLLPPL